MYAPSAQRNQATEFPPPDQRPTPSDRRATYATSRCELLQRSTSLPPSRTRNRPSNEMTGEPGAIPSSGSTRIGSSPVSVHETLWRPIFLPRLSDWVEE